MHRGSVLRCFDFYPRPPRGGRHAVASRLFESQQFLSTPSARRATCFRFWSHPDGSISIHALREEGDDNDVEKYIMAYDFYPRPPRGGRRPQHNRIYHDLNFYPRPPRGGRRNTSYQRGMDDIFLSTPSARRATTQYSFNGAARSDFYPRPPRGGRQQKQRQNLYFQTNYTTFCTNLEEP